MPSEQPPGPLRPAVLDFANVDYVELTHSDIDDDKSVNESPEKPSNLHDIAVRNRHKNRALGGSSTQSPTASDNSDAVEFGLGSRSPGSIGSSQNRIAVDGCSATGNDAGSGRWSRRSQKSLMPVNWGEAYLRNHCTPDHVIKELRGARCSQSRRIADFYERQNSTINNLLEPVVPTDPANSELMQRKVYFAIYGSLAANILLFCLQIVAAITSGSLSLAAAAADSFMDLMSGIILSLATWSAGQKNNLIYPTGKKRFHTVGLMLFASMMSVMSIFLMVQSIKQLIEDLHKETKIETLQLILVITGLSIKTFLLIYCWFCRSNPSARMLVQDHRNDIFVNTFGLVMAFLGNTLYKTGYSWIDPAGAIIIGVVILVSWTRTAWENVILIVGHTASPPFLNRLTYIAATHDERIMQVDTCRAYSLGHCMFVEIDIVLPPTMSLKESHDIGESLQKKIELIEDVERAFVHCDYEFTHRPEH